jgi:hypothetical protein
LNSTKIKKNTITVIICIAVAGIMLFGMYASQENSARREFQARFGTDYPRDAGDRSLKQPIIEGVLAEAAQILIAAQAEEKEVRGRKPANTPMGIAEHKLQIEEAAQRRENRADQFYTYVQSANHFGYNFPLDPEKIPQPKPAASPSQ